MNKNILLGLPMCVLLADCVQQPMADEGECDTINIPAACTGSESNPVLSITLVRNGIKMGPRNVCAQPDSDIKVSIHPPQPSTGTVKIVPKNPLDTWINESNDVNSDSITIHVPADVKTNADFDYTIIRSNGVCLDPRIKVPPG